ncbi:MAG: Serine/threonine-protein kinase PknD [Chlamydiales bacterium]|nr:Serine/threonine-protein kinase PknD [Chlamydiales bacterium]MCH9619151.1 Serine/threonine-protein kinase PknD [Chlamydiales bacterium]MCH9622413.1 Serine/threonine-protein kinase PknD [Chlamydiales bacterium]
MGEVLLAFDPVCKREVAIKRIRPDLKKHQPLVRRFNLEAQISASLTHPGIISIYSIEEDYYVMPYVEGKTLKQRLYDDHESIPALMPIFLHVCQTIAYIHAKGILHRDIKPENILVGTFGEVILLDWGLALSMEEEEEVIDIDSEEKEGFTAPGKLVGTVAYMPPERAKGEKANVQSEVYALGVILYQILTLHLPFQRPPLKEFVKNIKPHHLIAPEPEEIAPYREVPPELTQMMKRCLDPDPKERYKSVNDLLDDLKGYLEGGPRFFERARLNTKAKEDWQFQENVLISKSMALTEVTEEADWVMVMLSDGAFAESTQLKTRAYIEKGGKGIGFLLGVPEPSERENPVDGYSLWLGSEASQESRLFRNTVEVMTFPDLFLKEQKWHSIVVEKRENKICLILDGIERFTYISHPPLFGTHVGLLARDAKYKIEEIVVSVGSQSLQVSCLAIADAFLAHKQYKTALAEYQRIGHSFPGHTEGREALFRAGITLLEQAKNERDETFYPLALEEFSKLHGTPGAPLEYLGKALVYQALKENAEEIKCLELGLRRYLKHPLVETLRSQISYRMHEAAQTDRKSAYQLMLIVLRLLPNVAKKEDSRRLFTYLIKHWESLPFLESSLDPSFSDGKISMIRFAIPLAFWLASPYTLNEIISEIDDEVAIADAIYALFELGSSNLATKLLKTHPNRLLEPIALCHLESIRSGWKAYCRLGVSEFRIPAYFCRQALRNDEEELIHEIAEAIGHQTLPKDERIMLDAYRIWAYLKVEDAKSAGKIFDTYPLELLNQETTWLHPLFGCYLYMTEGEEISNIHFAGVVDTPHPRSWALLSHELTNQVTELPGWYNQSFMWERRQLYQLLTLYYSISENPEMESYYRGLERKESIHAE